MAHIQNTICRTKPWTSVISEPSVFAFTLRNFCHLCLTLLVLRHLPYSQFLREKVITDRSSSLGRITEENYCIYGWWLPCVFSEWTQKHDPRELGSKQKQKEPVSPTFFTEDNEKKTVSKTLTLKCLIMLRYLQHILQLCHCHILFHYHCRKLWSFMQSYLKVHERMYRDWCKGIYGPIFQSANSTKISLKSMETLVILHFSENVWK